jgi:hypothetical protein
MFPLLWRSDPIAFLCGEAPNAEQFVVQPGDVTRVYVHTIQK